MKHHVVYFWYVCFRFIDALIEVINKVCTCSYTDAHYKHPDSLADRNTTTPPVGAGDILVRDIWGSRHIRGPNFWSLDEFGCIPSPVSNLVVINLVVVQWFTVVIGDSLVLIWDI